VQAVAAALLAPSSLALLLPAFPPERRGFAVGTWGAMGGIAAATGPALGGLLVDGLGWRAVFLVNLPVVVVTLVAGLIVMAESRDLTSRLPDLLGVLLLGGGVALVAWGIVGGETSWTSPSTLARLVGGLGLLGVFAWRSVRVERPLIEPALFRVRAFRASIVGYLVFSAAFYALLLANVLYLTGVWHYGVLLAGLAVTPGPLMAALASAVGGRLTDRFGARAVIVPGALLFAAGCALFAVGIGGDPAYLTHFLPATLLTGTGVGAVFSGLGVAAVAGLPANRYATGSAVGTCARQIGAVFGISALLSGVAAGADYHTAWTLMAIAACLTAVAGYAVGVVRAGGRSPAPVPIAPVPDLPRSEVRSPHGGAI
nr:MFS transporter [Pseudonocardiales bacterium]